MNVSNSNGYNAVTSVLFNFSYKMIIFPNKIDSYVCKLILLIFLENIITRHVLIETNESEDTAALIPSVNDDQEIKSSLNLSNKEKIVKRYI